MADDEPRPLSEPLVIADAFCSGADVEIINGDIRIVGWVDHQEERRIVGRLVLPDAVARALIRDLRKALASGSQ
jgi:hypothetical protein